MKSKHLVVLAIFTLVVLVLYMPSLHGPFVFDDLNIERSSLIHITSLDQLSRILLFDGLPRRVGWASFALNFYAGGLRPFGYHLTNVLIHALNGFVLFLLCRRLLGYLQVDVGTRLSLNLVSATGSGLWLVHTVQTQSVSYVYQRFTCLSGFFFLFSIYCYVEAKLSGHRGRGVLYFLSALAGFLALGTKENTATLPLVLLFIEWLVARSRGQLDKRYVFSVVALVLIFAGICFFYLGTNFVEMIQGEYERRGFTLEERLLTEARVVVYYMSLLAFPHPSRLRLDYDVALSTSMFSPFTTIFCIALIAGLVTLALMRWRTRPFLSFSILWFFGNLVIESSVIPLDLVYEHRLYLPSMVPVVFFSVLVIRRLPVRLPPLGIWSLLALIGLTLSLWTVERNRLWGEPLRLWEDNARKSPGKPRVHLHLAKAYLERGRGESAKEHLERIMELNPTMLEAPTTLANLYIDQLGDLDKAEELLVAVLGEKPTDVHALVGTGVIHLRRGELDQAVSLFERVLELDRSNQAAILNLATAHFQQDAYNEVIKIVRTGIYYWPADARLYAFLGAAYFELGQEEDANKAFLKALELDPDNLRARKYLFEPR